MDIKKISIFFAVIFGFFVFWGGSQVFKEQSKSPYSSDSLFAYIMPKLKLFTPKFSLFDRTFVDDRKKLLPKQASAIPTAPANNNTLKPNPALIPPQNPNIAPGSPSVTPNEISTSSPQENDNDEDQAKNNEKPEGDATSPVGNPNFYPNLNQNKEKQTAANQINEWKMKIMNSPTREVMNQFVHEFETEKVSKEVFYQVMEDLVNEHSVDLLEITLYGLSESQSYDNLSFLLRHKDDYSGVTATMYKQALSIYEKPSMLKLLSKVLSSPEPVVVLGVMPLISKVGGKFTEWTSDFSSNSADDHRSQRGPATKKPKGDIIQIIKTLEDLRESDDHQIALAARETLNDINYHPSETTVSLSE